MQILSFIRNLRVTKPRDDERNAVATIEVHNPNADVRYLWGLIRIHRDALLTEYLTAGECVTIGLVLLAQGVTNQERGSMARAYTLSALGNLQEELNEQLKRDNAIANLLKESNGTASTEN